MDPKYIYGVYGVLDVEEIKNGRSGRSTQDFMRTYVRTYRVQADDPNIGVVAVRVALYKALGVAIGTQYAVGNWNVLTNTGDAFYEYDQAYCAEMDFKQESDDGLQWLVTTQWGPFDPRFNNENPLLLPPMINWEAEKFEEIADVDINGDAVVNSAGDYFDPPVLRDQSRPILTVVRNEILYDPHLAGKYADTVNGTTFFGYPPRTMKMEAPVARWLWSPLVPGNGFYWEVHYAWHANISTWDKSLLDQGMRQASGGTRKQIIVDGAPVSSPVLLSSGAPLAPGGTPEYIEYKVYPELDYAFLLNFGGDAGYGY